MLGDKTATARSKVPPNAFSDNFKLFWLLHVQCVGAKKMELMSLQLFWYHNCSDVLMWLGNADELLQICLYHAISCYQKIAYLESHYWKH
jgi:hypothetical protein